MKILKHNDSISLSDKISLPVNTWIHISVCSCVYPHEELTDEGGGVVVLIVIWIYPIVYEVEAGKEQIWFNLVTLSIFDLELFMCNQETCSNAGSVQV